MSRYEFKLPDIGEGVTEGEVVAWHVREGDVVREDQPLLDVMTDKATVTITSPKSGRIASLHGAQGEVVKVHSVLVVFDLSGGAAVPAAPASAPASTTDQGPAATAVGDIKENLPGMGAMTTTATAAVVHPAVTGGHVASSHVAPVTGTRVVDDYHSASGKALATPATRKLARDLGVDLARVRPTGDAGRVTRDDVRSYVSRSANAHGTPSHAIQVPGVPVPAVPAPVVHAPVVPVVAASAGVHAVVPPRAPVSIPQVSPRAGEVLEERVPFTGLRRKIADRMAQSTHTAAHFTFVEECDVSGLKEVRERMRTKAGSQGVKLTFLPFIVKAVVASLKKHPILNTALDETTQELVYRKYYNIGIAASSDAGLVVPVIKQADRRSLLGLAREIERLSGDVKAGKMKLEDLQGSTFTITSLGAQGGLFATPIINFPEVAILGVHQIKQKPVVRDGQIVIGDVMLLSLSFDHRVVDGHVGAAFAYEIIRYLQDPDALLLES